MSTAIVSSVPARSDAPALWALLLGDFVIAVGVLAPVGAALTASLIARLRFNT